MGLTKGSKPGRPRKRHYKKRKASEVFRAREMKSQYSYHEIAKAMGRAKSTVQYWLRPQK